MSKSNRNAGTAWTAQQNALLRALAKGNTPTGVMTIKLGRTKGAIQSHAQELGVSLKPVNQRPYNRQKGK